MGHLELRRLGTRLPAGIGLAWPANPSLTRRRRAAASSLGESGGRRLRVWGLIHRSPVYSSIHCPLSTSTIHRPPPRPLLRISGSSSFDLAFGPAAAAFDSSVLPCPSSCRFRMRLVGDARLPNPFRPSSGEDLLSLDKLRSFSRLRSHASAFCETQQIMTILYHEAEQYLAKMAASIL